MAANNQDDQVTPFSTDQQTNSSSSSSQRIEVIDVAQADESDSWETDDEGDFYEEEEAHGEEFDDDNDESFADIGLSKQLIECYPKTTAGEVSATGKLCDICLNEYKSDDKLRTIPCLHQFHCKCIDKWLKKNSKCPMCRSDLRKSEWYSD